MWRATPGDEERVKQRLRQEKQRWMDDQVSAGSADPPRLQFLSVGKLLRVIAASFSAADPHEALQQWGIVRHGINDDELRRRAADSTVGAGSATYTSGNAWLTGVLRFRENVEAGDALHLCDGSSELPCFLLDPAPQLVDQLVLVKRWVLVNKTRPTGRALTAAFLEVHGENPVVLVPSSDMYTNWAREDALAVLEANYPTQDPPLYTGTQPWVSIALAKDGADPDLLLAANAPESDSRDSKKAKKRKRVHAVYGRVTCVSPISQQVDRANCHFFVEVEHVHTDGHSTTQSVVNVMFTGAQSMQWHLFLRPGKFVLLSDLTKVFSRECGLFLLQTTNVEQPSATPAIAKAPLKTIVLIWDAVRLPSPRLSVASWVGDSFDTYSQHEASRCCGKLMDYEGRVSKLLWDDCVEIRGPDDANVLICLFHFPFVDGLVRLREGATVQIRLAHVLRWPTPIGGKLVLGLCPRSHFTITAYGGATSPCVVVGTRPRQGHSSKKWAQLGDFRRQSMILSMWLLESLELLAKKFSFGSDAQVRCGPSLMTFPRVRRREAVARVAKTLGFALASDREKTATTLGALFLNCHSHDTMNCVAIQMELAEKRLASTRVVTIRELQKFGEGVLSQMTTQTASGSREATRLLSLRISRDELDWCLLIGCIRGSLESGDLEICDRTGSIPLHLDGRKDGEALTRLHGGRCIYLIHGFELSVEDFNAVENLKGRDESFPLAYCVSGSASDVTCIAMNGEEDINWSPEGNLLAIAPGERQLLVLVTNVDSLPRSKMRSNGFLPEYRLVHGIVLPVGKQIPTGSFLDSVECAEILVNTRCTSWHTRKYGCYRIVAVAVDSKTVAAGSRLDRSLEEQALEVCDGFWRAQEASESNGGFCLQDVALKLNTRGVREKADAQARSIRVYRVESGEAAIIPVKLKGKYAMRAGCEVHELCRRSERDASGMFVLSTEAEETPGEFHSPLNYGGRSALVEPMSVEISTRELILTSVLRHCVQRLEGVVQVGSLLLHPLQSRSQQPVNNDAGWEEHVAEATVDPDLHRPHLISLVGVITKKKYYWRSAPLQQQSAGAAVPDASIGMKRPRELIGAPTRRLICVLRVRDLQLVDSVDVQIDTSRFGLHGALQLNDVVEFTRLQGFVARSNYKVYLNWSHVTAARSLDATAWTPPALDAELYGQMQTTFLSALYYAPHVDRRVHRYVVGVMHVNYVVLKRKCGACHRVLQFDKPRGCWKHVTMPTTSTNPFRECVWRQQLSPSDPAFKLRTYMGTTVRCIVDDGSAQAELFLENDVAWELLPCTRGQRRRFEEILSIHVEELRYFAGNASPGGFFSPSKAARDHEYYENELRALVVAAIPSLRSLAVFAQRFYSAASTHGGGGAGTSRRESTSVLTFGKDIQMTTKTVPHVKLEARRVDQLHVRSELQQRLACLRTPEHSRA